MQPTKWRETIDPYTINFKHFKLINILGYPHAGNDVFYVEGEYEGERLNAFIKVERQIGADIENEIEKFMASHVPFTPRIIEYSLVAPKYIITREAKGVRLSTIVGDNKNFESMDYLYHYGETLGLFHQSNISAKPVKHRRFFEIPDNEYFSKHGLEDVGEFLNSNKPQNCSKCFVHGDFHYANILWKDKKISCVLDYELSGIGIREFDMAWAIVLRPSQRFLKTAKEHNKFLSGYSSKQSYNEKTFRYFYVLIASHFYSMGDDDYKQQLKAIIQDFIAFETF